MFASVVRYSKNVKTTVTGPARLMGYGEARAIAAKRRLYNYGYFMQTAKETHFGRISYEGEKKYFKNLIEVDAMLKRKHGKENRVLFFVAEDGAKSKHPNWLAIVDQDDNPDGVFYSLQEVRNCAPTDHIGIKPYDVQ